MQKKSFEMELQQESFAILHHKRIKSLWTCIGMVLSPKALIEASSDLHKANFSYKLCLLAGPGRYTPHH